MTPESLSRWAGWIGGFGALLMFAGDLCFYGVFTSGAEFV